jgi:hypothetical protein
MSNGCTPHCGIDHITITAPTLAAGAELVRQTLGVMPQTGGEHPRMGTHNLLLRLGEGMFLEVIAPNPRAMAPARPRWFALDTLATDAAAALTNWVARTPNMQASLAASTEDLGQAQPMSRGALNWLITFPEDGSLPLGGVAPALIEWHTDAPPAARLPDQGLSLDRLVLFHPEPQRITRLLSALRLQGPVAVEAPPDGRTPGLVTHISTPQGLRLLNTPAPAQPPAR